MLIFDSGRACATVDCTFAGTAAPARKRGKSASAPAAAAAAAPRPKRARVPSRPATAAKEDEQEEAPEAPPQKRSRRAVAKGAAALASAAQSQKLRGGVVAGDAAEGSQPAPPKNGVKLDNGGVDAIAADGGVPDVDDEVPLAKLARKGKRTAALRGGAADAGKDPAPPTADGGDDTAAAAGGKRSRTSAADRGDGEADSDETEGEEAEGIEAAAKRKVAPAAVPKVRAKLSGVYRGPLSGSACEKCRWQMIE